DRREFHWMPGSSLNVEKVVGGGSVREMERAERLDNVLKQFGLEHSSMALIGADRRPEFGDWRVMVAGEPQPIYLDVAAAAKLEDELRRIRERKLAERIAGAIATAKRQMREKAK